MKFEHLVEINDILNPLNDVITREQLWRGLVLRAESPKLFVPYLDESTITARNTNGFSRSLRYGDLVISDEVRFVELDSVLYDVAAQKDIPQSSLLMKIEEPSPDALFVRFLYDDGHSAEEDIANEMYNEYRRSAYQEADIDTIRVIREMAEAGRLNALPS
ncbi:SRPBCC family protein [Undibacterium sp. RTI2.1]|uniref:SRPBCC family protein n=1 Tax=unclassified Undibacterium TaxID=2630295 RepID=UPI002AB38C32|nr:MULTISPECIES: SRPBCC family protein [unclassified Undibacterium]MDY7536694.1 SRPBCC family protein [Undibacterium sp. 5I1]MEB0032669.1 SRPBCC family protein [Undibacterium sp. RTI2.1]MEB0118548.1 SRPBCC family protein [Undibacterium sp. RTI2.2]MEB0230261.1 SRPBCC family protein [Undibacterium sp. 10I3]MEB0257961.1 SRPBCC family protein [Undibacterium sp. 5I1]